jgi:hypothetical protein
MREVFCELIGLREKIFLGWFKREQWVDFMLSDKNFMEIKKLGKLICMGMAHGDYFINLFVRFRLKGIFYF